jgi:hypothetical protein
MSVLCATETGELTIDGTSMHCPAWNVTDLLDLWMPAAVRGTDRIMPGSPGVRAKPRRATVTRRSLPIAVCGEVGPDGSPISDYMAGLESNIDQLRADVIDPTGVGDGTRLAVIVMPSGNSRSRRIHIEGLTLGRHMEGVNQFTGQQGYVMLATLEISIPRGSFVAGGS